jgi:hypothetical protein
MHLILHASALVLRNSKEILLTKTISSMVHASARAIGTKEPTGILETEIIRLWRTIHYFLE